MHSLWQDVRFGLRLLAHNPGFATVAILTLALGIGANTAIFTLVDTVALKTLPVPQPDQLVLLHWQSSKPSFALRRSYTNFGGCPGTSGGTFGCSFSYPAFQAMRAHAGSFSGLFAFAGPLQMTVGFNDRAHLGFGELVSGGFFPTLGVRPFLGRALGPEDDRQNAAPVAMLSYGEWRKHFGGSPSVIGQLIAIGNLPVTIVGVTPPSFAGLQPGWPYDFWLPLSLQPRLRISFFTHLSLTASDNWWLDVAGRLKPGVSAATAIARPNVAYRNEVAENAGSLKNVEIPHLATLSLARGLYSLRRSYSKPLAILMTLVGLVLLIACANVAGLLLARSAAREREMSIRVALGASRGRLTRQLLAESLVLAGLGGVGGWLLGMWAIHLLASSLFGTDTLAALSLGPDWRVFGFTLAASLLSGLLAGLAPSLHAGRTDASPTLKAGLFAGSRSRGASRWSLSVGQGMVVAQFTLALLVVFACGLLARTLFNLENVPLGFNPHHLLLFSLDPSLSGYSQGQANTLYKNAQQRLRALPGVTAVSWSNVGLIANSEFTSDVKIRGRRFSDVHVLWVGPSFFETMGIPVLLGRGIGPQDELPAAPVAVVNEAFARSIEDLNPVGLRFFPDEDKNAKEATIVGVVGNARYTTLRQAPPPTIYFADLQTGPSGATFELRTATDPETLVSSVRETLASLAHDVPLSQVKTQTEQIGEAFSNERNIARLAALFGLLALALACIGLYGLVAYNVARRTGEIGLRMALGATREEVLRMVLGMGTKLVVIGIGFGVALSLSLARLLAGMLYGVKGSDPLTLVATSLLLAAVALLACYIPARRAIRIDPSTALRYE